jgi:hypothetical protein
MAEADPWADFLTPEPSGSIGEKTVDPWAEFVRAAPTSFGEEPAVLPDVAKSAGIGLAKGAVGIPGLPGDVQALARHFSPAEYLGNKFAEHFPEAAQWLKEQGEENRRRYGNLMERGDLGPGGVTLPSSGDIQSAIENKVTGSWYEPQTPSGERAKTIASFVPQALATGGESVIPNLVKGAILPGAASQAAGEATQGTWMETPARILGAIGGALTGHGVQTGVNAARTAGAARSTAGDVGQLIGDPNITGGAVSRMAKDVRADELTPQMAGLRMAALGPEAMALDAGRQMGGRAEAIASQPGVGQNRVLDAVENRTGTFGAGTAQRVENTLDQTMGRSPDVVAAADRITKMVDQQSKPLYDSVMQAHPVVDVPAGITERPAVAQGMRDAESLARNYGETVNGAQPSLRYWDYVKKALDSRINGMMRSGGIESLDSAEKADLGGMMNARNALRDHLDEVTGGAYKIARSVAANKPQLLEALEQGQSALNTKLLPEQLKDIHDNMSIPQQSMLRMGMRREIERVMDTARNDGAAARRVLDTNQNREKIATLFGQPAADAIDKRIAAETRFQEATNKISANSRTQVRGQLVKDTESPSAAMPPVANLTGFATKGIMGALEHMRETGMERTRAALGSMSTTPGHQVPDLVRLLSGYNQAAAANARPPITPLAKTLARVGAIRAINNQAAQAQESAQQP